MAFCKLTISSLFKWNSVRNTFLRNDVSKKVVITLGSSLNLDRDFRKNYGQNLRIMKTRRKIAGPERVRHRNEWDNWNYNAELYAFPIRLHEKISEGTLRSAFLHKSYLAKEEQKRKELDIPVQEAELDLKSNIALIEKGYEIIANYVKQYLRYCFPKVPEEGIIATHNYLLSEEVLSHVGFNLGTSDLIFCEEFPPSHATLADTFKALVGAIAKDNDVARAEHFVLDFLCPQLVGKDILELWDIEDPLGVLNSILARHSFEECEPRLMFESGRNTIEAIYHVGLYSNKVFLGKGPGETLQNATEMAAYDVLRKVFGLSENEKPLLFGEKARALEFMSGKENPRLSDWHSDSLNISKSMKQ